MWHLRWSDWDFGAPYIWKVSNPPFIVCVMGSGLNWDFYFSIRDWEFYKLIKRVWNELFTYIVPFGDSMRVSLSKRGPQFNFPLCYFRDNTKKTFVVLIQESVTLHIDCVLFHNRFCLLYTTSGFGGIWIQCSVFIWIPWDYGIQ